MNATNLATTASMAHFDSAIEIIVRHIHFGQDWCVKYDGAAWK